MLILNLFILSIGFLALLLILLCNRKLVAHSSRLYYWILSGLMLGKLAGYLVFGFKFVFILSDPHNQCQRLDCDAVKSFEITYKNAILVTDLCLIELTLIILFKYYKFYCAETLGLAPNWITYIIQTLQVAIFGGFMVLIVIFNIEENHPFANISIGCAVMNLFSVLAYLLVYVYLKLTGMMTEGGATSKLKHFIRLQLFVFLGRAIEGTFNILMAINLGDKLLVNFILNISESGDELVMIIVYFLVYLLTTLLTEGVTLGLSVRQLTIKLLSRVESKGLKASMYSDTDSGDYANIIDTTDTRD
jgi:hypothetical protein